MGVITFICAGQMNSAITFPAFENGHEVRLVGSPLDRDIIEGLRKDNFHITLKRTLHDGVKYYHIEELAEALEGADLILGGVSSFGLDWFCDEILPIIPEDVPLLTVTKGMVDLEDGTLVPYPVIFAERQPKGKNINFNAIGGPCTSYELADHDDSHVAFCGKDVETLKKIRSLLQTDYYHISLSTDITGVECAVAMKNAYALGVTLAVGLSEKMEGKVGVQHYNSQAALFGQSVKEMTRLLALIGGKPENIVHGAGDLYVTVFGGRTRKIGTLLGRGLSFKEAMEELQGVTLESIVIATRTARAVRKLAERGVVSLSDYPLLMHVDAIINEGASVDIPWKEFTWDDFGSVN
ncbi:MAG: glycerol-3-phosphate dehydrogenase [Lachnospiraceae bacterium]|nr:glycerol-3-phosphate dehydrogenase [Lachnospiraceae bacterium]